MNKLFGVIRSLIKIRITLTIGLITTIGWYVAHAPQKDWGSIDQFLWLLIPTLLVCAGVCSLNHVIEWKSDSIMKRTKERPIPSGAINFYYVVLMGTILTIGGLILMIYDDQIGMFYGASITSILYLFIYTPLKKISWLNTSVGAIPGALPIMGGWFYVRGELGLEGWILFAILFFWQHPHFYAIAWICRNDYQEAGYKMLVRNDSHGKTTFLHSLIHTILLIITSYGLIITDFSAGWIYLIGITLINLWFFGQVWAVFTTGIPQKNKLAQKVITTSVWYQIIFFILVILDNYFRVKII